MSLLQGPVRRVAILGAGPASKPSGIALAQRCAQAGFQTTLEDVFPANLRRFEAAAPAANIRYATSIEDAVRDADLVIDTVPDELESKLEIFSLIDRMAPPATLIVTPTKALSIADLASCTYRAEQCFGLQFPQEADAVAPLSVTLVHIAETPEETLQKVQEFLAQIGFSVTPVVDTPVSL